MRRFVSRRGHMEFLVLLLLLGIVWGLLTGAMDALVWHGHSPCWYKVAVLALNPASLVLGAVILFWVPALWVFFVEMPAARVQMACWQFPREKVFGLPRWLVDRSLTGGAALFLAYAPVVWLACLDRLREVTFLQMMLPALLACVLATSITLLRAHFHAPVLCGEFEGRG